MAEVINMPRLSDTMEEGTVAKWLKNVGDKIEEGDILAEIETDKATMEFESFHQGTLLHIGIQEGDGAPVDTLLAIIGEEGEDISALLEGDGASKEDERASDEKEGSKETNDEAKEVSEETSVTSKASEETETTGEIPQGVEVVKMPRLSDTMEEGTVASWLKNVGDDVEEGDILAEIETDKATMEFESFYSGKLLYIGIQEGESSPVDAILAVIGPEGTDVDAVLSQASGGSKNKADTGTDKADKPAKEPKQSGSAVSERKPEENEVTKSVSDGERIFASPLAKKIAEDKGIDLSNVSGTGDNGRIIKKDIENYTPSTAKKAEPSSREGSGRSSSPSTGVDVDSRRGGRYRRSEELQYAKGHCQGTGEF